MRYFEASEELLLGLKLSMVALSRSCTVTASGSLSSTSPLWQAKRHQKPSRGTKMNQAQDSSSDFFEHVMRLPSDKIETKHDQVIEFSTTKVLGILVRCTLSCISFTQRVRSYCQQTCRVSKYFDYIILYIVASPAPESLWNGATDNTDIHRHTQTYTDTGSNNTHMAFGGNSKEQISGNDLSKKLTRMLEHA